MLDLAVVSGRRCVVLAAHAGAVTAVTAAHGSGRGDAGSGTGAKSEDGMLPSMQILAPAVRREDRLLVVNPRSDRLGCVTPEPPFTVSGIEVP